MILLDRLYHILPWTSSGYINHMVGYDPIVIYPTFISSVKPVRAIYPKLTPGVAEQNGDRYSQVHIPLPSRSILLLVRYFHIANIVKLFVC